MNKVIPVDDAVELIQSYDVLAVSDYGTNGE